MSTPTFKAISLCSINNYWTQTSDKNFQQIHRLPTRNENIEISPTGSISIDIGALGVCGLDQMASINTNFNTRTAQNPIFKIHGATPIIAGPSNTPNPTQTIDYLSSNTTLQIEKCSLKNDQILAPKIECIQAGLIGSVISCTGFYGTGKFYSGSISANIITNNHMDIQTSLLNANNYIQNSGSLSSGTISAGDATFSGGFTQDATIVCQRLYIVAGGPYNSTHFISESTSITTGIFQQQFILQTPNLTIAHPLELIGNINASRISGSKISLITTDDAPNQQRSKITAHSGDINTLTIRNSIAHFDILKSTNINNTGFCTIDSITQSDNIKINNSGFLDIKSTGQEPFRPATLNNHSGSLTITAISLQSRSVPFTNSGTLNCLGVLSGCVHNYAGGLLKGQSIDLSKASLNSGTIEASNITLKDTSINFGNIRADMIAFKNSASNSTGILVADSISFFDHTSNYATSESNSSYDFYNQSINSGYLIAANFYDNASNARSVSTAHFYSTSTNAYSGTLDPTHNWTFHDTSTNDGSLVRSNSISNKMSRSVAFSARSQNRNTVWGAKFIDSAKNIGTFVNDCDFYNTSVHNASSGTNLYFYDSSISSGNISASGYFFHRSSHKGSGNSLFFYDSSLNEGSANRAMFAGQSINRGISTNAIYSGTINRGECMISGSWLAAGANRGACSRGTFTFDQSRNLGTISDSTGVKFIQPNARNTGPIQNSTDCLFASGATNLGTLNNCTGVIFQQSINRGTLLNCTNLSFTNNSMNYGVISGSVSPIAFSNNSINYGTIAGSATFDNTSTNLGTIIPVQIEN